MTQDTENQCLCVAYYIVNIFTSVADKVLYFRIDQIRKQRQKAYDREYQDQRTNGLIRQEM